MYTILIQGSLQILFLCDLYLYFKFMTNVNLDDQG